MINSTSSSDRPQPPVPVTGVQPTGASRAKAQGYDRLSTDSATFLQSVLASQPEIRPEVVSRGQILRSDPGYPTAQINRSVANQILSAPDLSENLA
jgi:hypothetical protein